MQLSSSTPTVTLRNAPHVPYDSAIAAARTCYSPRVIGPAEITARQRETIGKLTYEGGHHTVYQHATFEFGLENVSRQFVWSALHSYPFYNSEQQSQRYVKLGEPRAFVPPLDGEARAVYERRDALGAAEG
jgi:thymidylate synthase ThyX